MCSQQHGWRCESWNCVTVVVHILIMCTTSDRSFRYQYQLRKWVKVNVLTCHCHDELWAHKLPWDCGLSFLLFPVLMILYSQQKGSQTHYWYSRMACLWASRCLTQQAPWSFAVGLASLEGSLHPSYLKDALPACFIVESLDLFAAVEDCLSLWHPPQFKSVQEPTCNSICSTLILTTFHFR